MLEKDALLSKISIIKRCLATIQKVTGLNLDKLDDVFVQDVFILNLQRSIQASIDMANILIAVNGWKLPASYKEAFTVLCEQRVIPDELAKVMMKMCGFRNIAVHDYQQITPEILKSILGNHLKDLELYYSAVYEYMGSNTLPQ